jgi:hypothetical protein
MFIAAVDTVVSGIDVVVSGLFTYAPVALVLFVCAFETGGQRHFAHAKQSLYCVIPAWSAGIQVDMDVSGSVLANLMDAGYPCRHDEVRAFILRE